MEIVIENLHFSSAHRLMHHPGKCSHMHGHNFGVKCTFYGNDPDPDTGMLIDFGDIKSVVNKCVDFMDHAAIMNVDDKDWIRFLQRQENNLIVLGTEPTAEEIAKFLFKKIQEIVDTNPKFEGKIVLTAVQIWETPKYSATYFLDDETRN